MDKGDISGMKNKQEENLKRLSSDKGIKEVPKAVLEYLKNKHTTIVNDYRTPDGLWSEHCGLIAVDIAKLLLDDGRQPCIAEVFEDVHTGHFLHRKELLPKIFDGRISWGAHQVCCCDGQAFDPIIGNPIPVERYTEAVFGEDINIKVIVPYEKIEEFVSR